MKIKKIIVIVLSILAAVALLLFLAYFNRIRTINSLKKIDDYPVYEMTWYGDYNLDGFLKLNCQTEEELYEKAKIKSVSPFGCTCFSAYNADGKFIHARNFDEVYSPMLVLKTNPKNGYKSISTTTLNFLGEKKSDLLLAPFIPADGMNEKGVSVSILFLPRYNSFPPEIDGHNTLYANSYMRLILDKAANVDEAIELAKQYNIINPMFHFMVADKSGRSVVIEFYDGEVKVFESENHKQVVSSFALSRPKAEPGIYRATLLEQGIKDEPLNNEQMFELMASASMKGSAYLQWTCLYNMNDLTVDFTVNGKTGKVFHYSLNE